MKLVNGFLIALFFLALNTSCKNGPSKRSSESAGRTQSFNQDWKFSLETDSTAFAMDFVDETWRTLNLPHDWSIELPFDKDAPATVGGGALPGGIGWYRKTFDIPSIHKGKKVFIDFDGVYWNSDVWINGHHLGNRPNGYISFRYDLTSHLNIDGRNVIAVRVNNSQQPNSRWYSGSGIYRNVWLTVTDQVYIQKDGVYLTTPSVTDESAEIKIETALANESGSNTDVILETLIIGPNGQIVGNIQNKTSISPDGKEVVTQALVIQSPVRWDVVSPNLYKTVSRILKDGKVIDETETTFGIRTFEFDAYKGFTLNGRPMKIQGVCNHHDLGALGAAINDRAIERQLEILKEMGVNAIRTAHNPPAPELLDLCDRMGFLVMDEMFDMWKKQKSPYDYSQFWDEWHKRDLEDFIRRDRNHASVIIWSIGNEIGEQWDSTGVSITRDLAKIVRNLDATRPITTGNNEAGTHNSLIKSGALDLIGFNYNHKDYEDFHKRFPGKKFIATETTSALATRGHYDMPSDSIRRWPIAWDKLFTEGNPDNTVSAYDNVSAPWGSTHEETWKIMKKYEHLSGMFIWTGFDYLGEPTPYVWPSRSSYFGVVDLAGFPKDTYFMYQSEWTNKTVLHVFPHWNWSEGSVVDMWAYYNNADEAELYLNNVSQGVRRKSGDDLHVMWRLNYSPGIVKVVTRRAGKEVTSREVKTAGTPAKIILSPDRETIKAGGADLSFVTVTVVDAQGTMVPHAGNLITFELDDDAVIAAVDNGDPTSHESFRGNARKAFHGKALVVVKSGGKKGKVNVRATSPGLESASVTLTLE